MRGAKTYAQAPAGLVATNNRKSADIGSLIQRRFEDFEALSAIAEVKAGEAGGDRQRHSAALAAHKTGSVILSAKARHRD